MAQRYNVFSLPSQLVDSLASRTLIRQAREPSPPPPTPAPISSAKGCNICLGAAFADVDEQRAHFRTDWHRYNVKVRLAGGNSVTEAAFAQLVDGLEDSLSGSASSDDESSQDGADAVDALLSKVKRTSLSDSPEDGFLKTPVTALTWFHSPPSTQIGVYRMLFPLDTPPSAYLSELKEMQVVVESGRKWAMFMVAGGHFAGAVVRVGRVTGQQDDIVQPRKRKSPKPKPETEVLKHKTFHRYTTRRKQGGSQSINDNAKGAAISAGAMLRRYGEQALRDDIRNLLRDWADDIYECERIFIRASVSNRRIFLDYEGCVINKGDDRLRTFPFPTRRPTQAELARCLQELVQVKVSHLTEEALRAQDEAYLASLPKPKLHITQPASESSEKLKPPRLTKEEELHREKWGRLLDMISKGRLEPLKGFWGREGEDIGGVDAPIPEWTGDRRTSLLQVASQAGHETIVQWLLFDLHADPTTPVSLAWTKEGGIESDASDMEASPVGSRRTAYDLARSRAVRDVFRRCASDHPDWWDWFGVAHVPSALSKEREEERDDKKKQRRKGLKEKMRERERERSSEVVPVVEESSKASTKDFPGGPQKLGGSSGSANGVAGLTLEMRAKVERERRARAAEARLKLQAGSTMRPAPGREA